jgi:predicted ribosome quality control (RQC) complex YloA/Tae2 family protein
MVLKFIKDNYILYLGENAQENWDLLKNDKSSMWLHLNNFPSGHCIITKSCLDKNYNKQIIMYGAQLIKEHSKYKNLKNIKVVYTELKNVKKGEVIGEVIIKKCKFIIL